MRTTSKIYLRFLAVFAVLGITGIGSAIVVLVNQRVALPTEDRYTLEATFTEAHGVRGGIGQPVAVVGVEVGQVTGVRLESGAARVTMEIDRSKVPRVYADATASLQPITPLGDIRIDLLPGSPPAQPLQTGATIGLERTNVPVPLSDLLSRLDTDTRAYLSGMLAAVAQGTKGRGPDLRRLLRSLGPTSRQVGAISAALARRRTALARFTHNLSEVTRASSRDGRLAAVVQAGNRTLQAVAEHDAPLRASIRELPATLGALERTLRNVEPFARRLGPTLSALTPAVDRLPTALRSLGALSEAGQPVLRDDVAPLIAAAQPVLRDAAPAVRDLTQAAPALTGAAQTINYLLNTLAHVPSGTGQGFLYWTAWAAHNLNSSLSTQDAHGVTFRTTVAVDCNGLQEVPLVKTQSPVLGACPGSKP